MSNKKNLLSGIIALAILAVLIVCVALFSAPLKEALSGVQFMNASILEKFPTKEYVEDDGNKGPSVTYEEIVEVDYDNLKDGSYQATEKGYTVTVVIEGGKIASITLDEGTDYLGKVSLFLNAIVAAGTIDGADTTVYAGATLSTKPCITAVEAALLEACDGGKVTVNEIPVTEDATIDYSALKDGSYQATEKGYAVTVVIEGGKIASIALNEGNDYEGKVSLFLNAIVAAGTIDDADTSVYSGATLSTKQCIYAVEAALLDACK